GLYAADQPLKEVLARFLPFIWWPLIVLLLTGIVMIVGEPPRSLKNPLFQIKMALLFAALVATVICQVTLRRHPDFGDLTTGRRAGAATLASISMLLWGGHHLRRPLDRLLLLEPISKLPTAVDPV